MSFFSEPAPAKITRNGFKAKNEFGRQFRSEEEAAKSSTKAFNWEFLSSFGADHLDEKSNPGDIRFGDLREAAEATEMDQRASVAKPLSRLLASFESLAKEGRDSKQLLENVNRFLSVYGALDFLLAHVGVSEFRRDLSSRGGFRESTSSLYALLIVDFLTLADSDEAVEQFTEHPFLAMDLALAAGRLAAQLSQLASGESGGSQATNGAGDAADAVLLQRGLDACRSSLLRLAEVARESTRRGLCWAQRANHFEYADGCRSEVECQALASVCEQLQVSEDPSMDEAWFESGCYGSRKNGIGSNQGSLTLARFIAETRRVTRNSVCGWLCSGSRAWPSPSEMPVHKAKEQERRYRKCAELNGKARVVSKEQAKPLNQKLTAIVLNVNETFIGRMIKGHVFEQSRAYSKLAHDSDGTITPEEEFQAGRNVWACMGLQLVMLRCKVECHEAVLGYSLLYPYTDNYLDDAAVSRESKLEFQHTFRRWLKGEWEEARAPETPLEEKIALQVRRVESRWPRDQHPGVFYSLVAIHDGQSRSMEQHCPLEAARYLDILDISADKGGTSVLADLYITHGDRPRRWHAAYAMNLGVGLQFVDDIQDIAEDIEDGNQTLFSVPSAARSLPADRSARRLCNYICEILRPGSYEFDREAESQEDKVSVGELLEGKQAMCFSIALKAISRTQPSFSDSFLKEAVSRAPLPMRAMAKLAGMKSLLSVVKDDRI